MIIENEKGAVSTHQRAAQLFFDYFMVIAHHLSVAGKIRLQGI